MRKKILAVIVVLFVFIVTPVIATTNRGTIQGSLSYPSDYLPSLIICAQNTQNTNNKYCLQSKVQQRQYSIQVSPGQYYIFASDIALEGTKNFYAVTGFYSRFVTCGLNNKCKDHTPIAVTVKAGQVINSVDPKDFYGKLSQGCS